MVTAQELRSQLSAQQQQLRSAQLAERSRQQLQRATRQQQVQRQMQQIKFEEAKQQQLAELSQQKQLVEREITAQESAQAEQQRFEQVSQDLVKKYEGQIQSFMKNLPPERYSQLKQIAAQIQHGNIGYYAKQIEDMKARGEKPILDFSGRIKGIESAALGKTMSKEEYEKEVKRINALQPSLSLVAGKKSDVFATTPIPVQRDTTAVLMPPMTFMEKIGGYLGRLKYEAEMKVEQLQPKEFYKGINLLKTGLIEKIPEKGIGGQEITLQPISWKGTSFGGGTYTPEGYGARKISGPPIISKRGASIGMDIALVSTPGLREYYGAGAIQTGWEGRKEAIKKIQEYKPLEIPTQATEQEKKEIEEYNRLQKKYLKDMKTTYSLQIAEGVLFFTPTLSKGLKGGVSKLYSLEKKMGISGGVGERVLSLSSKTFRNIGLTKEEFKQLNELSKISPLSKKATELRLKAIRFFEKKGDTIGEKAFRQLFEPREYLPSLKFGTTTTRESQLEMLRALKASKFPSALEEEPLRRDVTFGEVGLTKTQVSQLAGEVKGIGAFETKKEAFKFISSVGGSEQSIKSGLSTRASIPYLPIKPTERGIPSIKLRSVGLKTLKYDPFKPTTTFKSYGVSFGREGKFGRIEAQLSYLLGKTGKVKGLQLGILKQPPKSKFAQIMTYEKTYRPQKKIYSKGITLKQKFFDQYRLKDSHTIFIEGGRAIKLGEDLQLRKYPAIFSKALKVKREVMGPGELLFKFDTKIMPTQKALKKEFGLGVITEKQKIVDLFKKGKWIGKEGQVGLKKVDYPSIDTTLFLGESRTLSRKFTQKTLSVSEQVLPLKKIFPDLTKVKIVPKSGGAISGIIGGETKTIQVLKTLESARLIPTRTDLTKLVSKVSKPTIKKTKLGVVRETITGLKKSIVPAVIIGAKPTIPLIEGKVSKPDIEVTKEKPLDRMVQVSLPSIKSIRKEKVGEQFKPSTINLESLKTEVSLKPLTNEELKRKISDREIQRESFKELIQQKSASSLKQQQKQTAIRTTPSIIVPVVPSVPKPPVPPRKPIVFKFQPVQTFAKRRASQKTYPKAYAVEIKRRGKFVPFAKGFTEQEAIAIGTKQTVKEAAATFRLKQVKGIARRPRVGIPIEFRALFKPGAKQGTFVQKKLLRITTPGEKREISYVGAAVRRGKRKGFGFMPMPRLSSVKSKSAIMGVWKR